MASPSTCCRAVNLRNPSTREYRENRRKCLDAARIEIGQARPLRPPENLKAAGDALFAPIPGSEAVNLAPRLFVQAHIWLGDRDSNPDTRLQRLRCAGWSVPSFVTVTN